MKQSGLILAQLLGNGLDTRITGNYNKLRNFLIVIQILFVSILENVHMEVRRICILMLGWKLFIPGVDLL